MNIGFDAKRAFFNRSGLGNYSRSLIGALAKYYPGNKYYLYTPKYPSEQQTSFIENPDNIYIRSPQRWLDKQLSGAWRSLFMAKDFSRNNLDIYHGLSHELPRNITQSKVKKIVTIHDLIYLKYPRHYPWVDRAVYDRKFRFSCRVADRIIAISEQTKRDIIELFGIDEEKIRVVYQSCLPVFMHHVGKEARLEISNKYFLPERYVLYVGAFAERKNVLNLLRAFQQIGDPSLHLVLVGDGKAYKKKLVHYIEQHKLSERTHLLTHVPTIDLPAIYQQARLFAYPSLYEGFGLPIIEALYSKVPVITTRGGCFAEAGGPSTIYVNPENAGALADAIKNIDTDEQFRAPMIEEGYAYVQRFNLKSFAADTINCYREVLN